MSFLQIPIGTYPNTFLGFQSSISVTTGVGNTAYGESALKNNTAGGGNTAIGALSMLNNVSGDQNTSVGNSSMFANLTGQQNAAFGHFSLQDNTSGSANTAIGGYSLRRNNGTLNTAVGYNSGYNITTGSKNSILGGNNGNQGGLDIRTLSNYIVLSDGDGNPRLWIDNTGAANIPGGTVLPGGVANGVLYLNASNAVTSGTALNFNGTRLQLQADNPLLLLSDTDLTIRRAAIQLDTGGGSWSIENNNNLVLKNAAPGAAITVGSFIDLGRNVDPLIFGTSGLERMRLDASGNLGIGTTSTSSAVLNVYSATGSPSIRITALSGNPYIQFESGGFIQDIGSGSIRIRGVGASSGIDFDTNSTLRARIDSSGNFVVGAAALATNATNGFFYAPGCAGAPTGVPTSFTGRVPIVVDTTNNKLYFYSGGAWRDAGP